MPKETIADTVDESVVHVGWTRGHDVQIGVEHTRGLIVVTVDGETLTPALWATLDRRGANDLIRQIRKARDAAFGRDE